MHFFDLKTLFLARHAQHVVLIHFPIALLLSGVAFDAAASRVKRSRAALAAAAYLNLAAAALTVVPVVATGLLAWQLQLEGQKLKGALLLHLGLGLASAAVIVTVWWVHHRARRQDGAPELPAARWPLELLAVLLVVLTGHLGGIVSGVNLPG